MGKTVPYTYEQVYEIFKEHGYKLLDEEYKNSKTKMTCEDEVGYRYFIKLDQVKVSKPLFISNNNPYSIYNIEKYIDINGLDIQLLPNNTYESNKTKLNCACSKKHIFTKNWSQILNNGKCPICAREDNMNKQRAGLEEVKNMFIKRGYIPMFDSYTNDREKLTAIDKNGYKIYTDYSHLKHYINVSKFGNGNIYTIDNIKNYIKVKQLNCVLLSDEYIDNTSQLNFRCNCGKEFQSNWSHFSNRNQTRCNDCAKREQTQNQTFDYDYVKEYVESHGCKLLSTSYKKNTQQLQMVCQCGNKFTRNFATFKNKESYVCMSCVYEKIFITKRDNNKIKHFSDGRMFPCAHCDKKHGEHCVHCNTYEYFIRNRVLGIPNWSEKECFLIVDKVLTGVKALNDIVEFLDNKTLEDLLNLMNNDLVIRGVAELQVRLKCAECGKDVFRRKGEYSTERIYCDMTCRDKFRSKYFVGENNAGYNRIDTVCTNCGVALKIIPYNYNQLNSFGDNHNFCSNACSNAFHSKYYVGDKWLAHHVWTDEEKDKNRERMIYMLSNGMMPSTMTKPHIAIDTMLTEMSISHQNEYPTKYYSIDVYLDEYNLMIEVMGDYYHGNPMKYEYFDDLNDHQQKDVGRDKRKHTYIKKYYDVEILYLWEGQINNEPELCKLLIEEYIGNGGNLYDYNSYNYHIEEGVLEINDIAYDPYFIDRSKIS